jgi:hypothetical protein
VLWLAGLRCPDFAAGSRSAKAHLGKKLRRCDTVGGGGMGEEERAIPWQSVDAAVPQPGHPHRRAPQNKIPNYLCICKPIFTFYNEVSITNK